MISLDLNRKKLEKQVINLNVKLFSSSSKVRKEKIDSASASFHIKLMQLSKRFILASIENVWKLRSKIESI